MATTETDTETKSKKKRIKLSKFQYSGIDLENNKVKGVIEAGSLADARVELRPLQLRELQIRDKRSVLQFEITKSKVAMRDVMHFTRQLGAFLKAGIPILDSIRTLADEQQNDHFRAALNEIIEDIRSGATLSAALEKHRKIFPSFYIGMVQSAELSGNIDVVLDQISEYIERDLEARRQMKSALVYPIIILCLAIAVVVLLTTFVLPRFETFFKSLDADLPITTKILLRTTGFIGHWWWAIIALIAALSFLFYAYQRTDKGRLQRDQLVLNLPAIGEVVRYSIVERFCRVLATMQHAGVPLTKSMAVVSDVTTNRVYYNGITEITAAMVQGQGLAAPVTRTGLFPPTMTQMVRVGEETGTLDEQLMNSATFFSRELDYKVKKLISFFEPAVLIFVGVVVGFVAIALVSAMYGIYRQNI